MVPGANWVSHYDVNSLEEENVKRQKNMEALTNNFILKYDTDKKNKQLKLLVSNCHSDVITIFPLGYRATENSIVEYL